MAFEGRGVIWDHSGIWRQLARSFAPNQGLLKFGHALARHANRGLISQVFSSLFLSLSLVARGIISFKFNPAVADTREEGSCTAISAEGTILTACWKAAYRERGRESPPCQRIKTFDIIWPFISEWTVERGAQLGDQIRCNLRYSR